MPDFYACVRPVRYFAGVGNPMKQPEKPNVVMLVMLEYMGWREAAAALIVRGPENAIKSTHLTYYFARQMPGATEVSTLAFGDRVIRRMAA